MDRLLTLLDNWTDSIVRGFIVIAIGFVLFSLMERIFSLTPAKKPWHATLLDLKYAFLSMLFPPFIYFIISATYGWLAIRPRGVSGQAHLTWLVFAGQLLAVLFVRDCLIYLRHRIFHTRPVWAFHSIHHSSEEVNWISAARFHPAENIIETTGEVALFLGCGLIGMNPTMLSLAALIIGFYNLFIHSNVRWTYGPLRYIFVSPVFHRWHHSDLPEARDKNFAAMFSCLDLALGTFYMPMNVIPQTLGLSEEEKASHPRSLTGQLLYPFKKR